MAKIAITTVATAIVLVLGLLIDEQSQPAPATTPVSSVPLNVSASGWVEGRTREVELRFQVTGKIMKCCIKEGELVERQQPLISIHKSTYQQTVRLAQAELQQAQASLTKLLQGSRQQRRDESAAILQAKRAALKQAENSWQRTKTLSRDGIATKQQFDDDQARVETLRAEVAAAKARADLIAAPPRQIDITMAQSRIDAARAQCNLALTQLRRTSIRAPFRGRILQINRRSGELVSSQDRQPTVVLVDTNRVRVRAFVEEIDAARITLGQHATITIDGLSEQQTGEVTHVAPRMQRKRLVADRPDETFDTKVREVWIDLDPNQPPLIIGLRVNVSIAISDASINQVLEAKRTDTQRK